MRLGLTTASAVILVSGSLLPLGIWVDHRMTSESAPVARGAAYAGVRGCVECHGDPDNPGPDVNDKNCSDQNRLRLHPAYNVDCRDAMSYFAAIRLRRGFAQRPMPDSENMLFAGEALARKYHCFQCHGELGQGGFANAGSLKGYVPGYFGKDLRLLTRNADPGSVRNWIENGIDRLIVQTPVTGRIAEYFFDRQAVGMPSFKSLPAEEIDVLVAYVIAVNGFGPMTADAVRAYGRQSRATINQGKSNRLN